MILKIKIKIKKIIFSILPLIFFSINNIILNSEKKINGSNKEIFLTANYLLNEKKYLEAIEKYTEIKNPGAAVFQNLSVCFYNLLESNQNKIQNNNNNNNSEYLLQFKSAFYKYKKAIRNYKQYKNFNKLNNLFFNLNNKNYCTQLSFLLPTLILQILILLCLILLITSFFYKKKASFCIILIFSIIFLIGFIIKYRFENEKIGLIIKQTNYYSLPEKTAFKSNLDFATTVKILEKKDKFFKIELLDKKNYGWVKINKVKIIK